MKPPVDKLKEWERAVALDTLPYDESLVRLYEMSNRYNGGTAFELSQSASAKHLRATGHRLNYGCCADKTADEITRECLPDWWDVSSELYGLPFAPRS